MPPFEAQKYLEIVRERGKRQVELKEVYQNIIRRKELFLMAYAKLYANKGALTPGTDPHDTIDGMSMKRIDTIVDELKEKNYSWTPVRRTYIEKKNSQKKRPLGIPGWKDKLLQEVIRMVLEAYYGPRFRESSHGFRPQYGCHTALERIAVLGTGTRWFIEGDIKGCFDNISHKVLMNVLKRDIKDKEFLRLIWKMLKAGYMEGWKYYGTYSGTPQGGIVSPLLSNIVLHELDTFVEDTLIPKYTKGKKRRKNPTYSKLASAARRERKKGNLRKANELRKRFMKLPSKDPNDSEYRRLWYCRYADDFLLGYIGSKAEATIIKEDIQQFLKSIELEMSEEKTLLTHAMTGKARFLNYEIGYNQADSATTMEKTGYTRRTVNGRLWLSIPQDVITRWTSRVSREERVKHRAELINISDYDIIRTYETELQGLINYYSLAHNVGDRMNYLRYTWETSLLKTLARKRKMKMSVAVRKYKKYTAEDGRKIVGVTVERNGKKPLIATFGSKPLTRQKRVGIQDEERVTYNTRNELITRLLADTCEICGSTEDVEAHHIRKLADLKKKWQGKPEKPQWVQKMVAMRRKTLFTCKKCHLKIHQGKHDGQKLTKI
jgi:group II intron reverse transcriptase/maturase